MQNVLPTELKLYKKELQPDLNQREETNKKMGQSLHSELLSDLVTFPIS